MSIQRFPQVANYKVADTGEIVFVNGIQVSSNQQLRQVIVTMYKHGNASLAERLRANLYADAALTKKISTGSWFKISSITTMDQFWIGRIGLNISSTWVKAGSTYYIGIESDSYTRDSDNFYIAFLCNSNISKGLSATYVGLRGVSIE